MKSMLKLLGILILSSGAALGGQPERYLHVRVDNPGQSKAVRVNMPLSMAEKILPTIQEGGLHDGKFTLDAGTLHGVDVKALIESLRGVPDNDFVTIQNGKQDVRVAKSSGNLVVRVRGNGEKNQAVDITVPLNVVEALFSPSGNDVDIVAAVRELENQGQTLLVTIQNAAQSVRIWVDEKSAAE